MRQSANGVLCTLLSVDYPQHCKRKCNDSSILQMRKIHAKWRKLNDSPQVKLQQNPHPQIPHSNASSWTVNTVSTWCYCHGETEITFISKAVIYFAWALLLNTEGLRTLWFKFCQNGANFQQPHNWNFLYKQRQARECTSQPGVITAVLLLTCYYSFQMTKPSGSWPCPSRRGAQWRKQFHTALPCLPGPGQPSKLGLWAFVHAIFTRYHITKYLSASAPLINSHLK